MQPWDLDVNLKSVVIDFTLLSILLVVGTVFRRYGRIFQKYLIPNNITGGLIGLVLGQQMIGLIDFDSIRLGQYVYHLLALTFIVLGLRQSKTKWGKGPVSKSFIELSCYITQAMVGLSIAFVLIYTIKPDLFAGIGFMLPLSFGMGPGIAYTMGQSWEKYGFENGGLVGITFAVIGFFVAYFVGAIIINRGIRNGETALIESHDAISNDVRIGVVKDNDPGIAGYLTLSNEAIEPLAFQLSLIGGVYFLTYLFISFITGMMAKAGLKDFVDTVWSFHFVIALLVALAVRFLMDKTHKSYLIDRGLMTRLSGAFVDYLIVASIAAISIAVVWQYWIEILFMSLGAGLVTYFLIRYTAKRAFDDYPFERFIGIFGEMTGTINSGLVLIRVTDPEFSTPAAEDLAYGGGIALFMGFPLLILLNLPMVYFNNSLKGYWITFGLIWVYLLVLWLVWYLIGYFRFKPKGPQ
ncbi:MAG: hypothetical protein JXQ65_00655 [Candidatus Marinimicrobia bacterium]|nr:hypothetical protein [Candidatus Neomarinimicrobiota bacterium]